MHITNSEKDNATSSIQHKRQTAPEGNQQAKFCFLRPVDKSTKQVAKTKGGILARPKIKDNPTKTENLEFLFHDFSSKSLWYVVVRDNIDLSGKDFTDFPEDTWYVGYEWVVCLPWTVN